MVILITTAKCFVDYFHITIKKTDNPAKLLESFGGMIADNLILLTFSTISYITIN